MTNLNKKIRRFREPCYYYISGRKRPRVLQENAARSRAEQLIRSRESRENSLSSVSRKTFFFFYEFIFVAPVITKSVDTPPSPPSRKFCRLRRRARIVNSWRVVHPVGSRSAAAIVIRNTFVLCNTLNFNQRARRPPVQRTCNDSD